MAKAGYLIGRSGAGGPDPPPRPTSNPFTALPPEKAKEAKKSQASKKESKAVKGDARSKGSAGSTTSPSVRPKV